MASYVTVRKPFIIPCSAHNHASVWKPFILPCGEQNRVTVRKSFIIPCAAHNYATVRKPFIILYSTVFSIETMNGFHITYFYPNASAP